MAPPAKKKTLPADTKKRSRDTKETSTPTSDGQSPKKRARATSFDTFRAGAEPPVRLAPGTVVVARVDKGLKARDPPSLMVRVSGNAGSKLIGRVDATCAADPDEWTDDLVSKFKDGQFVQAVVLRSPESSAQSLELSLRPSLLALVKKPEELKKAVEQEASSVFPKEGELVTGFVVATNSKGCFVRLSRHVTARVELRNLAQSFVDNVQAQFPTGKLVAGRVLSVDGTRGRVELSLKRSVVLGDVEFAELKPEMNLDGFVRNVTDFGVFVTLMAPDAPITGDDEADLATALSTGIVGLCHATEVTDAGSLLSLKDLNKRFTKNARVRCRVLRVDREKRKVSLGMKPSYFADDVVEVRREDEEEESDEEMLSDSSEEESDDENDEDEEMQSDSADEEDGDEEMLSDSSDEDGEGEEDEEEDDDEDDDEEDDDDEDEDDEEDEEELTMESALNRLKSAGVLQSQPASKTTKTSLKAAEAAEAATASASKSKRERTTLKRKAEAETTAQEHRIANDEAPESVEDFERLLVGNTDSSLLWIQYVAFLAENDEVERARAIGRRALKSISFRETKEKKNVWRALLTLEVEFGTPASCEELAAAASKETSPDEFAFCALASALVAKAESTESAGPRAELFERARQALARAHKLTKHANREVWEQVIKLAFDQGKASEGRKQLKDALRTLGKKDDALRLTLSLARLEFAHPNGERERGRTIAEGVLQSYPKRRDVWTAYVDMELKSGEDAQKTRALFERGASIPTSSASTQAWFKKWLSFERGPNGGGEAACERVKEKARAYIASLVQARSGAQNDDEGDEEDEE